MKFIFSILALLIIQVSIGQNTTQLLSEKVKVVFPGIPEAQKLPTGGSMYLFNKDTGSGYMAMGIDLSGMGLSAEIVTALGDMLWEQLKTGMTAQMGGVTILKDEVQQFKGKSSLYLELDGSKSDNAQFKGKKAFGYLFFTGAVLHQVMYLSSSANATAVLAKPFFDSVEIAN